MGKIRINKLALELNVQNDQILDALKERGHTVKNYMSSIDIVVAGEIRELFNPKPSSIKTTPKTKTKATKKVPLKKEIPKQKPPKTKVKKTSKTKKETKEKAETTKKKVEIKKVTKKALVKDTRDVKPEKVIRKNGTQNCKTRRKTQGNKKETSLSSPRKVKSQTSKIS